MGSHRLIPTFSCLCVSTRTSCVARQMFFPAPGGTLDGQQHRIIEKAMRCALCASKVEFTACRSLNYPSEGAAPTRSRSARPEGPAAFKPFVKLDQEPKR